MALVRDIVGEEVWSKAHFNAEGSIQQGEGGFHLELRMHAESGDQVRSLDAKACQDLLGASAVVLGLNVRRSAGAEPASGDPEATTTGVEGTSPPPEGQSPTATGSDAAVSNTATSGSGATAGDKSAVGRTGAEAASQSAANRTPAKSVPPSGSARAKRDDPTASRRAYQLFLALPQVGLGLGALPKPTLNGSAAFGLRYSGFGVGIGGRYQLPVQLSPDWPPEVNVSISRYAAELILSWEWQTGVFGVGPQASVALDFLSVRGGGDPVVGATATSMFVTPGLGLSFRLALSGWASLFGTVSGEVPTARPRFLIDGVGEVGRLGPVALRLGLGSEWKF